jgi:internalin A
MIEGRKMTRRVKRWTIFTLLSMLVSVLGPAGLAGADVVVFPDPALEAVIRDTLAMPVGDIHDSNLEVIDILHAGEQGIVDITGIGHCINLEVLDLNGNAVTDLSELSGLSNLYVLDLDENGLENIAPLSDVPSLTTLTLSYNKFQSGDLDEVLAHLPNLTFLNLSGNYLGGIGNISLLANLERLHLADNQIQDITGLGSCSALTYLNLHKNLITNIEVLATLDNLEFVDLTANPVSDFSPVVGVQTVYRDMEDEEELPQWVPPEKPPPAGDEIPPGPGPDVGAVVTGGGQDADDGGSSRCFINTMTPH